MSVQKRVLLAVALVLAGVSVADAQRRAGNPVSPLRLATAQSVQSEIGLSDEQKTKVNELSQGLRDSMRELAQNGERSDEMRQRLQELADEADGKLKELLDDAQRRRLTGLFVRVNGSRSFSHPAVSKALAFTKEQTEQIKKLSQEASASMRTAWQDLRDAPREERRDKLAALRRESSEKVMQHLSPEQKQKLEALKGKPFEFDMSEIRRRRN